jgi:hypothetical protein
MHAIVKMVKNTHINPINQALHFIGAPFYVIGLALTLGHFAGFQTHLAAGIAMWIAALAMFVSGHMIEGNIRSMTPVLLFRLLSKIAHNFVMQRLHLFRL